MSYRKQCFEDNKVIVWKRKHSKQMDGLNILENCLMMTAEQTTEIGSYTKRVCMGIQNT